MPPSSLQLEIAEGFLAVNRELALGVLTSLSNTGVTISVDDFGTGHSSPTYLRGLPIDEIKLDNSLVIPIGHDARAAAAVARRLISLVEGKMLFEKL